MSSGLILNAWYVAAWAAEVQPGQMLARQLLDEPVVLFRALEGSVAALLDRCPHRFAPLSMGRLSEGGASIQCRYHGLEFNVQGHCTKNPHGDGVIPKAATVRAYPVVEKYSAIWIWMGDPARADVSLIPHFDFLEPEQWAVGTGYMAVDGNFELENDNILDLSHIEFMHPLFSSEGVRNGKLECIQEGETVWSKRTMLNDDPPAFVRHSFGVSPDKRVDRWLHVRWDAPSLMALYIGGVESGRPPEEGRVIHSSHLFTPESAFRTHYFYSMSFPLAMGPMARELADRQVHALKEPFEQEDKPIIEAVQQRMQGHDFAALKPVLLAGDGAAMRARRLLQARREAQAYKS